MRAQLHIIFIASAAILAACSTAPKRPDWPLVDNSFIRGDKASPTAPKMYDPYSRPSKPLNLSIGAGYNPDRDAAPVSRTPPFYPASCMANAKPKEDVFLEFDVTPEGTTTNIRVVETTNACFNNAALVAVERWRYRPARNDEGKPRQRRGVQTLVTFELTGPAPQ